MMTAYQKNDTAEIWILPLADDSGSMAVAKGSIKVASQASETGVISLSRGIACSLPCWQRYSGANCDGTGAAIAKKTDLPVTAAVNLMRRIRLN
jgi:phage tail sheath gpL-like